MFQRKADRRVCHVVHFRAICVDIYHVGHSYVFALTILITFTCLGPVYSIDEIIHNIYRPTSAEANNFQSQILKRRDLSGDLRSSENQYKCCCPTVELSRLFVCLAGIITFFSAWENRKNCWVMVCLGDRYPG